MVIKKRNSFRLTRFILLKLPYLLRLINKLFKPRKRLLIIKIDAIGDYVLFRNYLEVVRTSQKFKDYEIDLIGNIAWKDIALWYDKPFISRFRFIKPDELYESPRKVLGLALSLFNSRYEIVLQPAYTRTFIGDGLAALTGATNIIGFESDTEGIAPRYKIKTDKYYSELLKLPKVLYFEFDRSRFFFEQVLKQSIDLTGPHFPSKDAGKQGVTVFLGAGNPKRGWRTENFSQLMELIMAETARPVNLVGGPEMEETAQQIEALLPPESVINMVGKTSLPKVIDHIMRTSLVICNETSAVHMAAACGTKAVCILGGGHFERFAPYPEHVYNRTIFVYEKMPCYNCNWLCIYDTAPGQPFPCIDKVTLADAWRATRKQLGILPMPA
ncbi:glycosyltransferase family 9 protein [Mucilaginibacter auburnensis]|uniref:ADP-heptose:LPS heptosyltransferase n=1 Tax=Mucilaginibacter auburnensis TaxID=1457233 RepID=A0A2H9VT86_9SPHI|nr:glycosyltransferase family 9 protein [Mucilaginibacter auburnensis]PJJ84019.1 ADP-heptose:LPS heptosyltransferase [Mucilaginibacter auburnensis]